jgi:hypothetical protein
LGVRIGERVERRFWLSEVQEGVHVVVVPHGVESRGGAITSNSALFSGLEPG